MQYFAVLFALISVIYAENVQQMQLPGNTAYGYIKNIGIPEAERIRKAEEQYASQSRIVGGVPAGIGQYRFQAGLLGDVAELAGVTVCGGSLISSTRVATAAHCWNDGVHQAWRFTVVLGSIFLFSGGTRVQSSAVATHPSWNPLFARNDVAVIYLADAVPMSDTIAPVALPSGSELFEDFANEAAIAVGFGLTEDGGSISINQQLSHVSLNVITNRVCSYAFPLVIQPSHICTSGVGGGSPCSGDSGGPLVINRDNRQLLIGVASFVSTLGCEANFPAAFSRVTSYMDFLIATCNSVITCNTVVPDEVNKV